MIGGRCLASSGGYGWLVLHPFNFDTMTWADMEAHEDNMPARFGKDDARGWSGIRVTEFQASGSVAV